MFRVYINLPPGFDKTEFSRKNGGGRSSSVNQLQRSMQPARREYIVSLPGVFPS